MQRLTGCLISHFYSRPCGRGDVCDLDARTGRIISTHAPAGGATRTGLPNILHIMISTHAPAGGATSLLCRLHDLVPFLLTPLREGRPARHSASSPAIGISTHAPAGGATLTLSKTSIKLEISTHAPAGGATQHRQSQSPRRMYFYSRPCGRGDSNFPQVRHEVLRQIAER